ncbi:MAG: hypothetical protein QME96_15250 [Myxococcota bacterium]|nr:hypothetical protein [Myxococcota bacterium]
MTITPSAAGSRYLLCPRSTVLHRTTTAGTDDIEATWSRGGLDSTTNCGDFVDRCVPRGPVLYEVSLFACGGNADDASTVVVETCDASDGGDASGGCACRLDGSAVPRPGLLLLLALAVGGALAWRRDGRCG